MRISDWSSDVCSSDLKWSLPIMEAVAKAPEFARAGFIDQRLYRRQCRIAVIRWQHLPETRKETCLFQMQVGDQQRLSSEEHTSELQSLMRTSYAVFCLKKKRN